MKTIPMSKLRMLTQLLSSILNQTLKLKGLQLSFSTLAKLNKTNPQNLLIRQRGRIVNKNMMRKKRRKKKKCLRL
jgi:dGTP triphosphohydrolase